MAVTVPMSLSLLGPRVPRLVDLGWEVHVVVGEPVPERYLQDVRAIVHVIPMRRSIAPAADLRALVMWLALIGKVRPTHVWAATPKAGLLGMLAGRMRRTPRRVIEIWGLRWEGMAGIQAALLRASDWICCRFATDVVAVSASLAVRLRQSGLVTREAVVLANGGTKGVDVDRFVPRAPRVRGMSGDALRVGFLGRLAHDKGLADLLVVADLVHRLDPTVEFVLAGDWDEADPPNSTVRSALVSRPNVRLMGHIDDVPGYLQSLDLLCFPSHREGLPNAVIEAAACGVPVVGWRVTGTCDVIRDGVTGYLVPLGQHQAMADAIMSILTDPATHARMAGSARAHACDRFPETLVVDAFLAYLGAQSD